MQKICKLNKRALDFFSPLWEHYNFSQLVGVTFEQNRADKAIHFSTINITVIFQEGFRISSSL